MSSNRLLIILCCAVITFSFFSSTNGQIFPGQPAKSRDVFSSPLFLFDTYHFMSSEDTITSRLDVYVAFANDILQFVKGRQGNFTAGYDLFVSVFDKKGNLVTERSTGNRKITVTTFEATNNQELKNEERLSFDLIPGDYKMVLDLTDYDTQKNLHREKQIHIKTIGIARLSLSEIIFADKVVLDSLNQIREIIPNLDHSFSDPRSLFWAFFEIYPIPGVDSLRLTATIMDATDHAIMRNEEKIAPAKRMIPYLVDLSKEIKNPGRYSIVIHVKQTDKEATIRGRFSANWSNFEFSRLNINTAIEALKEFIPAKDFDTIGQSADSEKEAWFNQFWKDRDPTPDTDENELQEEYYRRVDFANNQFTINSLDKEGWKTDRGGIYIKYGAPTDVERHIDEMNLPPYEIWLYEGLQRRFIFEDKSGVGDFQLVRIE